MKLTRISALLVAAVLPLAACDNGTDPDDLRFGEFEARVTGDISANLDGNATSGASPGFGQDQILLEDLARNVTILAGHQDDEFTIGRESIVDIDQGTGPFAAIIFENSGRGFISTNGFIDLEEVDSQGLVGTLEFDAVEFDLSDGTILTDRVHVEVTFNTRFSSSCCGIFTSRVPAQVRVRPHKAPAR